MTADEFQQWSSLTHAVVRRCYWWAYRSHKTKRYGARGTALLDYEDLINEGNIALVDAWDLYDKDRRTNGRFASFKTYAYRCIVRRVGHYVEKNMFTHVEARGKRVNRCMSFTDYLADDVGNWQGLIDVRASSSEEEFDQAEWQRRCIDDLRARLGKRKTNILLRWARGDNLTKIGRTLGITSEWARVLINEWMVRASAILAGREQDWLD